MSSPLLINNFLPLSGYMNGLSSVYFNTDRDFANINSAKVFDSVPYNQYEIFSCISDITFNENALVILTANRTLSSILNNLTMLSSTLIGYSGFDVYNKYFWDLDNAAYNETVDVDTSYPVKGNFLITIPYNSTSNFNIIPLKNAQGVDYEYDFDKIKNAGISRQYDAVYLDGNNNILCQFRTSAFPVEIANDVYNELHIPDGVSSTAINSVNLQNFGANWGDAPCNSDVILLDRYGYANIIDSGSDTPNYNGQPLCIWLSGNTVDSDSSVRWMERWYDPNVVTQGNAFISQVNTTSALNPIIDKVSTSYIHPKTKLSYLRMGKNRNETFVNNFSDSLTFCVSSWGNVISDSVNSTPGFIIPSNASVIPTEAIFDGTTHYQIPPNDTILIDSNMTMGLWVYQDQWDCGVDTQYFGNFSNAEGYGIFFNTGNSTDLLTFPSTSGFVYGFNNKGYRVFEKSINQSVGVSASKIDYILTDLYGARWMYDSINKKVYKLDTDDLLEIVISLPANAKISKMQINSHNELYILDTQNNRISGFDVDGNLKYGPYSGMSHNNFEITKNNNFITKYADIMVLDDNSNVFTALGINIYKNNVLFYNIGYAIEAFNIDSDENLWILYNFNHLLKLASDGTFIFDITLPLPFTQEGSMELNFVKEVRGQCDQDFVWIVFNDNNYVLKLNSTGTILKYINVTDVVNLKACKSFSLNVNGDFTGFNSKKKFNCFSDGSQINSSNPAISVKINLHCANNKTNIQLHTPSIGMTGWNHIAVTHAIQNNTTVIRLYVNSILQQSKVLNGIFFIDYGSKVSPFIIGGRSGKLGATNVEVGLNNEQYFQGKINDVRIYSSVLNCFQLRGLSTRLYYNGWHNMTWYMPTLGRTYMEEIEGYHLNAYRGSKSNKYNIVISRMGITDSYTQSIIESSIQSSIKKFTPVNTQLNEIIFQ